MDCLRNEKYNVNMYLVDCNGNEEIYETFGEHLSIEDANHIYQKEKKFYESCGSYSVLDSSDEYTVFEDFDREMSNKVLKIEK